MRRSTPCSASAKNICDTCAERTIPLLEVGLLAADMERDAVGIEPPVLGLAQQVLGHLRRAAELLAERPLGAAAIDQHAAEHLRARRDADELLQLRLAVEGEQAHALLVGPGDVLLLLDRVAEGDAIGRDAGGLHQLDLAARGGVELGAGRRQARQDLRRRVGLHGVEDVGRRQQLAHAAEVVLDHVEIDHEAQASRAAARGGNGKYARSLLGGSPSKTSELFEEVSRT